MKSPVKVDFNSAAVVAYRPAAAPREGLNHRTCSSPRCPLANRKRNVHPTDVFFMPRMWTYRAGVTSSSVYIPEP